jgi:hypothetical protein
VLDRDVILLRKVNFKKLGRNFVDTLASTNLRAGEPEGDMPWFLDGYVAAEQPRAYQESVALLEATEGFALARTDTGSILAEFGVGDYVKASDIANKAKAEVAVNIMTEAKADDDEGDDEDED